MCAQHGPSISHEQRLALEAGANTNTADSHPRLDSVQPAGQQTPGELPTVAQCLAKKEAARSRSRSPSPMPPSPPPNTTPSRPPRPRLNSSPPKLKLVAIPIVDFQNIGAQTGGDTPHLFTMNLDAILSKLTPVEQAKYLRAKVEVMYLNLIDNSGTNISFKS